VQVIDCDELLKRLRKTHARQMISLTAVTIPRFRRQKYSPKEIRKVVYCSGVVNFRDPMRKHLKRKTGRLWGTPLADCCLVTTIDAKESPQFYLDLKIQHRIDAFFEWHTGRRIPSQRITPLLTHDEAVPATGAIRDFRITNIAQLSISAETFVIVPLWTELQRLLRR